MVERRFNSINGKRTPEVPPWHWIQEIADPPGDNESIAGRSSGQRRRFGDIRTQPESSITGSDICGDSPVLNSRIRRKLDDPVEWPGRESPTPNSRLCRKRRTEDRRSDEDGQRPSHQNGHHHQRTREPDRNRNRMERSGKDRDCKSDWP